MSGVNGNQSISDFAKLVKKRNDFIQISLAMDRTVKLYHRCMLSLFSPTKRESRSTAKKSSATRRDWGTARKPSSTKRNWDPSGKASSSTRSALRWNPTSQNAGTRNRFESADRSDRRSEEMEISGNDDGRAVSDRD